MKTSGVLIMVALAVVLMAPAACGRTGPAGVGEASLPVGSPSVAAPSAVPSSADPSPSQQPPVPALTPGATSRVVSSRVAYQWHWPNDADRPASVTHQYAVPPVPQLVRIGAGDHPRDPGERPYNRMTFTFTTAMPGYTVRFADRLVADGSGAPVPLRGNGVLRVTFRTAQAHTADGTRSTIQSQPSANLGMHRMVDYAAAGDFEGVVTYGIGIAWPVPHANPQIAVRVYELVRAGGPGARQYVVAIDVDAR